MGREVVGTKAFETINTTEYYMPRRIIHWRGKNNDVAQRSFEDSSVFL